MCLICNPLKIAYDFCAKCYDHFTTVLILQNLALAKLRKNNIARIVHSLGPVAQGIVSLTNSLRGQLVKCFTTLLSNTMIFFVEKKASHIFSTKKILAYLRY